MKVTEKSHHHLISLTLIASLITTVTAITGVYFGLQTLTESARSNQGNMILTLNRDIFFNDRLYKVRQAINHKRPILQKNQGQSSEEDLDDYIGMFETMEGLRERKILDENLLNDNFCSYIVDAYQNKEVKEYIVYVRNYPNSKDLYTGFEYLATHICK